jgi:hypothetical protein
MSKDLNIASWTVIEGEQLTKINMGTKENMQQVKVNFAFELVITYQLIELLKGFKDVFAYTYKNLKGIPLEIVQHQIELDTTVPHAHQTRYQLNPNYIVIVKQDIDKLLVVGFIKLVEEVTWLYPIVVVPKKNGKLKICVDFRKFNGMTKKDLYLLPFIDEVINTVVGHKVYTFIDGFLKYH